MQVTNFSPHTSHKNHILMLPLNIIVEMLWLTSVVEGFKLVHPTSLVRAVYLIDANVVQASL